MAADEPLAGAGEELAKLLAAARNWAQDHPTPCGYCPVCQLISAWPTDRPDLGEKLVQALDIVAVAARSLTQVFTAAPAEPADRPPGEPDGSGQSDGSGRSDGGSGRFEPPPPRVQHIDIS